MHPDGNTGKRIKQLRKARGLSQRQLATDSASYAYISRIEAGARTPSWSALVEIAEKLGTTALELGTGKPGSQCFMCGRV